MKKYVSWEDGGADAVVSIDEVRDRRDGRLSADAQLPEGCTKLSNPDDPACIALVTNEALSEKELLTQFDAAKILAHYRVLN